jgi:hypothetical protein
MGNLKGEILFKIRKQEVPQKFSGREKDKILNRFNPKYSDIERGIEEVWRSSFAELEAS